MTVGFGDEGPVIWFGDKVEGIRLGARQCFTRVNQKKKLGIDEDPAPDMLWQAFMKCYQRVRRPLNMLASRSAGDSRP